MIVTFCGHRDTVLSKGVKQQLEQVLRKVLEKAPNTLFYLGDYGRFDGLCNSVLKELQAEYPVLRRIFVTPYLDPSYGHFQYVYDYYDEVLYPFTDRVLKRFAIVKRNQWMVDKADYVIAYVEHGWGGAAKTLDYAIRKKIPYINFGDYKKVHLTEVDNK